MSEKRIHELFAGITAPRTTRERILFVATELFYTHGFNAVGLDQILTEADLTKTTFYNHFQSKDDLVEQAIQLRDQWETEAFTKALHKKAGYEPRSMLIAFFDVLHDWFTAPEFRGCLFLMAVTDYPVKHHPAHRAGAAALHRGSRGDRTHGRSGRGAKPISVRETMEPFDHRRRLPAFARS